MDEAPPSDWKLQLRYGKLKTPFSHFYVIAEGEMTAEENEFGCPVGNTMLGMKAWATSSEEARDMIRVASSFRFRSPREEDFGWIFFYNSKRFADTGEYQHRLAGNGPVIVDRDTAVVSLLGTAGGVDHQIAEFRKKRRTEQGG